MNLQTDLLKSTKAAQVVDCFLRAFAPEKEKP
jgi:hypothetical protein